MHLGLVESRRAAQIHDALGSWLDAVQAQTPERCSAGFGTIAVASPMTRTMRQATG